ncbi:hypothetical protein JTE90_002030 [Oedothorax gibbosus]|uniref:PiggyBac transposable element-derived protein domain-containing protein n=1 Tax=Oedothorax gibbosus TaxID=931172 RepID=A0AAV6UNR0_9ARAC|nr:hypothetical protein JTE90_002030 [Oedothorax gibbosus]
MATREKILTQDEILQILNENDSELSGFSDDDGDDQTFEPRMLEGQSSSDDEENDQIVTRFLPQIIVCNTSPLQYFQTNKLSMSENEGKNAFPWIFVRRKAPFEQA